MSPILSAFPNIVLQVGVFLIDFVLPITPEKKHRKEPNYRTWTDNRCHIAATSAGKTGFQADWLLLALCGRMPHLVETKACFHLAASFRAAKKFPPFYVRLAIHYCHLSTVTFEKKKKFSGTITGQADPHYNFLYTFYNWNTHSWIFWALNVTTLVTYITI